MHDAVLRRADVDALAAGPRPRPCARRVRRSWRRISRELLADLAAQILVDLQDLQLDLGDLALRLRDGRDRAGRARLRAGRPRASSAVSRVIGRGSSSRARCTPSSSLVISSISSALASDLARRSRRSPRAAGRCARLSCDLLARRAPRAASRTAGARRRPRRRRPDRRCARAAPPGRSIVVGAVALGLERAPAGRCSSSSCLVTIAEVGPRTVSSSRTSDVAGAARGRRRAPAARRRRRRSGAAPS